MHTWRGTNEKRPPQKKSRCKALLIDKSKNIVVAGARIFVEEGYHWLQGYRDAFGQEGH